MILVGQLDSPYVRRVAVSLRLLGFEYEQAPLSVFADAEAMRRINPLGRVPALQLGSLGAPGETLVESAAILDWLDEEAGPARALLPPTGPERRRQLQLVALATGCIDKLVTVAYERSLRPADRQWPTWIERCLAQVRGGLAALEARATAMASGEPWFGGSRIGQADITIACMLGYLEITDPEWRAALAGSPLDRLAAACEALPAFAATKPEAYFLPGADQERGG